MKAVSEWPVPENARELKIFLGTTGYHRRYIHHFSQLASPLYELVNQEPNKGKKRKSGRKRNSATPGTFGGRREHQESCESLKSALTTAPVLGFADFKKPFILETDVSHQGLGALLLQEHDKVTQLLLPSTMKDEVLQELHERMGHQGIDRVDKLVRSRFYWPNIRSDIQYWSSMCERCNLAKMSHLNVRTHIHSIVAREPLEVIAIDFTILEPANNGIENVLVMTDQTAQTVALWSSVSDTLGPGTVF